VDAWHLSRLATSAPGPHVPQLRRRVGVRAAAATVRRLLAIQRRLAADDPTAGIERDLAAIFEEGTKLLSAPYLQAQFVRIKARREPLASRQRTRVTPHAGDHGVAHVYLAAAAAPDRRGAALCRGQKQSVKVVAAIGWQTAPPEWG
jgi:hypothetical protein